MDPKPTADSTRFSLSVSADRDGFFRRACPSCGGEFKTELDPSDLQWALSLHIARSGLELGSKGSPEHLTKQLICPYCGERSDDTDMHTDETREYLKRYVIREFVLPAMNNAFADFADSFGSSRSRGPVSMRFEHTREVLPVRPVHGPEPADFTIIEFLCCKKQIKIRDIQAFGQSCTFCGAAVTLV